MLLQILANLEWEKKNPFLDALATHLSQKAKLCIGIF
jgi:hypothetical protein